MWTYAELWREAGGVAARLAAAGMEKGARVLLLAPQGLAYVAGFYGALFAGVIPVTLPAPRSRRSVERVRLVAEDCAPVALLVTQAQRVGLEKTIAAVPALTALPQIVLDGAPSSPGLQPVETAERAEARDCIAFLQYTSGSTSEPKGVMVTHANLAHQCGLLGAASGMDAETTLISWLPLNHDMGLLAVLAPLFHGGRTVLLPSAAVLQRPLLWLETASREPATMLVGPDFGYAACAQAAERDGLPAGLDLSTLTTVWTGAEPVRAETLERFTRAFAPAGFRAEMWLPCYGMAETTLMATGHRAGTAPLVKPFSAEALAAGHAAVVDDAQPHRALTGCGVPRGGMEIAIVAPETREVLPEDRVGEIWVRGASVGAGYFGNEALTDEVFRAHTSADSGPWLRTGDLGFLHGGELFPCGRLKDMIKLRGRNLYPQDIEAAVATALPWLAPNGCAAFVVEKDGAEAIGLLIEADRTFARVLKSDTGFQPVTQETLGLIRQAVTEETEATPALIAFTGPADFPRTTSGKVRRSAAQRIATTVGDQRVLLATGAAIPPKSDAGIRARNEPPQQAGLPASLSSSPMPTADLDSILTALRIFGERHLNSALADQRRTFGPYVLMDLAELGLFGMQVPAEEGGLGLSSHDALRISMQLGAIDISLAALVGIHNGLGLGPILAAATPATRAALVPVLASGRGLAAYALTEIGPGGSNPRGLRTVARQVPGGYVLQEHKIWIGLAPWARVITIIANAVDSAGQPLGTLACLVRRGNPGLRIGEELLTTGVRAIPQNHVHLEDAFIPEEDALGLPGEGMALAMPVMQSARLGIAAMSTGAMQRCAQLVVRYASQRIVATGPLLENPVTHHRFDWMLHAAAAAEGLVNYCAAALDAGRALPEALYATAKITAPENLATVADWTLQILGGAGYTETNEIARITRDVRVLRIFEGPTETLEHHLGTQARRDTATLTALLNETAPAATLGQRLSRAAKDAPAGVEGRLGRLAAELVLLAALPTQGTDDATLAWQEQRCTEAEAAVTGNTIAPAGDALLRRVQALTARVGDLHRRAAGEDHQPHPFLASSKGILPLSHPPDQGRDALATEDTALLPIVTATLLSVLRDQVDGSFTTLDVDTPLSRYGMDSLATVEAAVRLERATGRKLSADLLAQATTAREVARLLAGEPLHTTAAGNGSTAPKSVSFPQRMAQAMERVNQLRAADRYPFHRVVSGFDGGSVIAEGKKMLMLGSYEYLNILDHPLRVTAAKKALDDFGTGGKGVPILAGRTTIHVELEKWLAHFMNAEDAIIYTGGYITNLATVATFVGPGDVVIGDALNHASIVDGCRYSGARFVTFAHNDLASLERLLAENAGRHTLVVVEGSFSMDGDIGIIPPIAELCRKHGAYLMVDEAHSLGVLGATGRGVQKHFGLASDAIDLKMGTLSKALGGVGGFVAGKADIIDYMRHQSRGYLFSGALPPPNAAASLAALDVLEQEPWRVARLQANARRWRDGLKALGYDTFASETPIVPVRMPDETAAFEFAHRCKERGVFVVPVVFPAVPQNAPRLRTCVTAGLTDADLDMALEVFAKTGRELGVVG